MSELFKTFIRIKSTQDGKEKRKIIFKGNGLKLTHSFIFFKRIVDTLLTITLFLLF